MNLVVKGGETLTPPGKEGLASLTAGLLTEGTASRDALALAGESAEIGASINAGSDLEGMSLSMTSLSGNAPKALALFTDVLLHPSFPAKELERLRVQRLGALLRQADNPATVAERRLPPRPLRRRPPLRPSRAGDAEVGQGADA